MNIQSIMDRAEQLGSTARTVRGAAQFIVRNTSRPNPLVLPGDPGWKVDRFGLPRPEGRWAIRAMTPDERDIRRAKADPRFRRRFVAGLRREFVTITQPKSRTLAEVTAAYDRRKLHAARLAAIKVALKRIQPKKEEPKLENVHGTVRVEVGERIARQYGVRLDMRGKDARILPTRRTSYLHHIEPEVEWKKGRPVGYTRATRDNYVRSFVMLDLTDSRRVDYALGDRSFAVMLPEGFRWSIDGLGLRALRGDDDYHVSANDLVQPDAGNVIAAEVVRLAARRTQRAELNRTELGDLSGVYVCLADSLRAGNCRAGSVAFVGRMALNPSRHYPADRLVPLIATEPRVKLAIRQAVVRTRQEIERGYAILSDHRVAAE